MGALSWTSYVRCPSVLIHPSGCHAFAATRLQHKLLQCRSLGCPYKSSLFPFFLPPTEWGRWRWREKHIQDVSSRRQQNSNNKNQAIHDKARPLRWTQEHDQQQLKADDTDERMTKGKWAKQLLVLLMPTAASFCELCCCILLFQHWVLACQRTMIVLVCCCRHVLQG